MIRFALRHQPAAPRRSKSTRRGLGPDPAHHQRDRRARPRHPRLHRPPTTSSSTPPAATQWRSRRPSPARAPTPPTPPTRRPSPSTEPFQAADCAEPHIQPAFTVSTSGKAIQSQRGEPQSQDHLPQHAAGHAGEHHKRQGRTPQAAPLQADHPAEGVPGSGVRHEPRGCPPASIVGHAKAITPILPVPLEGPAYFVSYGGEGSPSSDRVCRAMGSRSTWWGNVHLKGGDHREHVQDGPRPARHELRTDAPSRPLLRVGGEWQPLRPHAHRRYPQDRQRGAFRATTSECASRSGSRPPPA